MSVASGPTRASGGRPGALAQRIGAVAGHRADLWGCSLVAAMTVVVTITWAPLLDSAFGADHEGRVFARFGLQIRNLHQDGLLGSSFATDMEPYQSPYAHHPPLLTILDAVASLLPGESEYEMRLAPYLLGLLTIPAGAALLRVLHIRWAAVLIALGLMLATPFYWVYGRLVFDLSLLLLLAASIISVGRHPEPSRRHVLAAGAASLLACLATWLGIAFAAVFGLWLLWRRRLDRVTVTVGAFTVIGTLISLAFMVGIQGLSALGRQAEVRTSGGEITVRGFLEQQGHWFAQLLPDHYLVLLPLGVIVGLITARTRFVTAATALLTVGWVALLPNGAYVHDYWSYVILIPGLVGTAALTEAVLSRIRIPAYRAALACFAGLLLTVAFVGLVNSPVRTDYLIKPLDAGELVRDNDPRPGQAIAWYLSPSTVRWLSYYWDLPPEIVTPEWAALAHPEDLVFAQADRVPAWVAPDAVDQAVARDGNYVLIRMADLIPR